MGMQSTSYTLKSKGAELVGIKGKYGRTSHARYRWSFKMG